MSKSEFSSYPCQPVYIDENQVVRFKDNKVALDLVIKAGGINSLDWSDYPIADVEQFNQLLGWSVSAWSRRFASSESIQTLELLLANQELSQQEAQIIALRDRVGELEQRIKSFFVDNEDLQE
jgi:hypothetical protein